MNILDKFENVEIKNETRISSEDIKYCDEQQELYIKVLENYNTIQSKILELKSVEDKMFENIKQNNEYNVDGYTHKIYDNHFVSCEKFIEGIEGVHRIFINKIYDYFKNTYEVELDSKTVEEITGINKPERKNSYYGFCRLSEDEIMQEKQNSVKYEKELDKFETDIRNYIINYNQIIDDIFIQLGGYGFSDKKLLEIKTNCKNACYNNYNNHCNITVKKNKIAFENVLSSYKDSIWGMYRISLDSNAYKSILRALTFYDSDGLKKGIYYFWLNNFVDYDKKEDTGIYGEHDILKNKIKMFKYYKNGKFEVTFETQENALDFAITYCGYVENVE